MIGGWVGFIGRLCVRVSAREGGAEGTIGFCERRCRDINLSYYFKFLMISLPKLALLIISSFSRMKDVYINRLINTSTSTEVPTPLTASP